MKNENYETSQEYAGLSNDEKSDLVVLIDRLASAWLKQQKGNPHVDGGKQGLLEGNMLRGAFYAHGAYYKEKTHQIHGVIVTRKELMTKYLSPEAKRYVSNKAYQKFLDNGGRIPESAGSIHAFMG